MVLVAMPFRRRIKRQTMGKVAVKHSQTLVSLIGNGSSVTQRGFLFTNAGDRSADGSGQDIQDKANTTNIVQVGTVVKNVRIELQAAITPAGNDGNTSTQGWIEWAVVWRDEATINIPVNQLGVQTLGDIAQQMFRGDCLLTGNFPVSVNLPNQQTILLKLPKKCTKWNLGDTLLLYMIFRDADTTDLQSDTVKLISSYFFKAYN